MPRLRHSDPAGPGLRRVRRGRGFSYLDADGAAAADVDVQRARDLAIPPAWTDVWICPWPHGHIQATGLDDAGRRQYLYHEQWRARQDRLKHEHVLEFAAELPALREQVASTLNTRGLNRDRVLAAAVRMLDLGLFRIGGEHYAEQNGTFGLATLSRDHVRLRRGAAAFDYVAKGGLTRRQEITDPKLITVIRSLRARRNGGDRLLAYYGSGAWHDVHSDDINAHLKTLAGPEASAKDFRTWHATVLAAIALADSGPVPASATARRKTVTQAVKQVAEALGNTPAVCRASYIDGRVIDRYHHRETIASGLGAHRDGHERAEQAVLHLVRG